MPQGQDVRPPTQKILKAAERFRSPSAVSDRAVVYILNGELEQAVSSLQDAVQKNSKDPILTNDLAVAYLERGRLFSQPRDFALACVAAGKAVALAPSSPEAHFNLALALTKTQLVRQARPAWQDYLGFDSASGWAAEARQARRKIRLVAAGDSPAPDLISAVDRQDQVRVRDLISRSPQESRRYAEEDLLGEWAVAKVARHERAAERFLQIARAVGDKLAQVEGDPMVKDTVATIDQASRAREPRFAELINGHLAYRRGLEVARRLGEAAALSSFEEASRRLTAAHSPFAAWAVAQCAVAHHHRMEYGGVLDVLAALDSDAQRFPALRARVCWLRGLAHLKLAHFGNALELYRQSLHIYERMGEEDHAAALSNLTAEALRLQGEVAGAWRFRFRALSLGHHINSELRIHQALFDTAEGLLDEHRPEAALYFHNEMVAGALQLRDPIGITEALLRRSHTRAQMSEPAAALADLAEAQRWLPAIQDDAQRSQFQIALLAARGEVWLQTEPQKAAQALGAAITSFAAGHEAFRLPPLYRQQARAFLAMGDDRAAESSLQQGIVECEAERRTIHEQPLAQSYFEQERSLYEDMVRLQSERRGNIEASFAYAERWRARDLLDTLSGSPGEEPSAFSVPLGLPEIARRLSPGSALVEYAVLDDHMLAWVVSAHERHIFNLPVSHNQLVEELQRLYQGLANGSWDEGPRGMADLLYNQLLLPLRPALEGMRSISIIPDRELHQVPFAALHDGKAGRYLVEDLQVSLAPSATVWARALEARSGGSPSGGALVVGDPAIDVNAFPQFGSLAGGRREAQNIAALYPASDLLTGAEATPAAFLAQAPHYSFIHLATHSYIQESEPLLSAFVLAPTPDGAGALDAGRLYARDIYRLHLSHTKMVVLAACDTAAGPTAGGEGIANLARPFLAAGVPLLIASLWKVNDIEAAQFFRHFHSRLLRGEDPVGALRAEQVATLHGARQELRSPALWGTFETFGAVAQNVHRQNFN